MTWLVFKPGPGPPRRPRLVRLRLKKPQREVQSDSQSKLSTAFGLQSDRQSHWRFSIAETAVVERRRHPSP
jgi:hypothetical protein